MPKVPVYNMEGQKVGETDLPAEIFGQEVNMALIHEAVKMHRARARQGTAATKTRGLVSGGGRKPWRQKGTGRARHGSTRSPLWVGGGTIFGPSPRDYGYSMPRKARREALRSALSSKAEDGAIAVLDNLKLEETKTKLMAGLMAKLNEDGQSALVVMAERNRNVELSSRNLAGVDAVPADGISVYDVMGHGKLIITKDAIAKIEEVFA